MVDGMAFKKTDKSGTSDKPSRRRGALFFKAAMRPPKDKMSLFSAVLGAVGLLLALAFLYLALLPATWVDRLLQAQTRGSLAMTATTGSFWRGEGALQAILPTGDAVTLAQTRWRIAVTELLSLRLHVTLHASQTGGTLLDAALSPGETRIHEARLDLPAALLGVLSPTLRSVALSGQMAVQATDLRLEAGQVTGKARVMWQSASSGMTSVRPLGNYQLDLEGQNGGLDLRLTTLGGALNLTGTGRLQPGKAAEFNLTASPVEAKRQELSPLLRMLGREVNPGTYQLTLDPNVRAVSE